MWCIVWIQAYAYCVMKRTKEYLITKTQDRTQNKSFPLQQPFSSNQQLNQYQSPLQRYCFHVPSQSFTTIWTSILIYAFLFKNKQATHNSILKITLKRDSYLPKIQFQYDNNNMIYQHYHHIFLPMN